ncbi:MAG: hypothetical protein ACXWMI_03275, partial [Syntrophales bacterium]
GIVFCPEHQSTYGTSHRFNVCIFLTDCLKWNYGDTLEGNFTVTFKGSGYAARTLTAANYRKNEK